MSSDLRFVHVFIGVYLLVMLVLGWGSHWKRPRVEHGRAPTLTAPLDGAVSPSRPLRPAKAGAAHPARPRPRPNGARRTSTAAG